MKKKIELDEMKKIQVEMLKYIDQVCKENQIKYFLIGGSLIGAIRHNGFIPWDDDIDIALTREDYNKLLNILKEESNKRYKLLDHSTQADYFYPFAKLVDSRTTMIENKFKNIENYGVYIDIFAYHGLPSNEKEKNKQYKKIKSLQRKIFHCSLKNPYNSNFFKNVLKFPFVTYARLIGPNKILRKYDKVLNKYSVIDNEYAISNWPIYKKQSEIQNSKNLEKVVYHQFENIEALILSEYDQFLKTTFGEYMKLPPESERKSNHDINVCWKE